MIPATFTITHSQADDVIEHGPASVEVDCRGGTVALRVVQDDGELTGWVELAPDQAKRLAELMLRAPRSKRAPPNAAAPVAAVGPARGVAVPSPAGAGR